MNDSDILHINEEHGEDESIRSYQFYQYSPITGTQLNQPGEIRITIESQDEFFHPHSSYLLFTGRLAKAEAGATYANDDKIALINNAMMYLFSTIKYELSGHEIESINFPGPATTIQGLLKYSDDFEACQGLNMCWIQDKSIEVDENTNEGFATRHKYLIHDPTPKGTFNFIVPLKHIFGFCEDYVKIVYGMKHMLTLVRTTDNDAIIRANDADAGKITLQDISWFMPRVLPSDGPKLTLYKIIEHKPSLSVGFRMRQCDTIALAQSSSFTWRLSVRSAPERPRFVLIALQTEKTNDQQKNPALFDHCNVKNMHVILNSDRYPVDDYNVSFPMQRISRFYKDAADFISKYNGVFNAQCNFNPQEYIKMYPLFVFDVSRQSERLKTGIVDVTVNMEFTQNVPANTQAYAVVICDRILKFQGDGSRMNVIV